MKSKSWLVFFIIDAILDPLFVFFQKDELRYITKPLLVVLLFIYLVFEVKNKNKLFFFLSAALFFSFAGDVLLKFEKQAPLFFMFGLIGFLAAHIFYIILFFQIKKQNRPQKKMNLLHVLFITAYTAVLFFLVRPSLGSLEIPVLIYSVVLSCMFLSAVHAFDFSEQKFGMLSITGAAFFLASDSLLAINKFYHPVAAAEILVMLTYISAQLLIVLGVSGYITTSNS